VGEVCVAGWGSNDLVAPRPGDVLDATERAFSPSRSGRIDSHRRSGSCSGEDKEEKEAHGEIETEHPGYLGSQDTYYVGTLKGVGRIYQQTFVDTYSKVAIVKLYDRKHAITAADALNDRVLPFFRGTRRTTAAHHYGPRQ
jgi:hypothetical protein